MNSGCGFVLALMSYAVVPQTIQANEPPARESTPHYGVFQFAGSNGLLSAGMGTELPSGRAAGELLLGYAPASVAGLDVWSLGAKARYQFAPRQHESLRVIPYLGMGLYYYLGEQYRISHAYPDDYYPYSAWHLMPHIGVMLEPLGEHATAGGVFLEVGVLDHYLIHRVNNPEYLDWSDVVSISLGMRLRLP